MCNLNDWIQRYNDRTVGLIIGGDFNTDLDKSNPASDLLNRFIIDYKFETCDTVKPRIVAGSRIQAGPRIQAGGSSELYQ